MHKAPGCINGLCKFGATCKFNANGTCSFKVSLTLSPFSFSLDIQFHDKSAFGSVEGLCRFGAQCKFASAGVCTFKYHVPMDGVCPEG